MLESKWWEGPLWLKSSEDWPAKELTCEPSEIISETRKSELVNVNVFEESIPWYAVRFSNYHSIVWLMGWILDLSIIPELQLRKENISNYRLMKSSLLKGINSHGTR
ncbi:hypothetical protein TNIN_362311 [Trichonephila inaurata madagascariensis]|uniref:Uncharacterized protein n=1 Tax=Trichonephila inaurata madagascariensis TaxID=2747483 RepID=A0A8X6XHB7_9ARAC|nr:hypothetical protein TNIN_362311 [Trichonephila inaurata madagascariensis]